MAKKAAVSVIDLSPFEIDPASCQTTDSYEVTSARHVTTGDRVMNQQQL
jgi:hypothetical protein